MIGYATFGARDQAASVKFFEAVLGALDYQLFYSNDTHAGFAPGGNPDKGGTVWVSAPFDGNMAQASNGTMMGFVAPSRAAVRAFHEAALANGGTCEGPPGVREAYGPDFYLAYIRDPVGNKLSAVCRSLGE